MTNSHQQMKDEKARRIAAVDTFKVAEKRIQDLNTHSLRLTELGRVLKLFCKGQRTKQRLNANSSVRPRLPPRKI